MSIYNANVTRLFVAFALLIVQNVMAPAYAWVVKQFEPFLTPAEVLRTQAFERDLGTMLGVIAAVLVLYSFIRYRREKLREDELESYGKIDIPPSKLGIFKEGGRYY